MFFASKTDGNFSFFIVKQLSDKNILSYRLQEEIFTADFCNRTSRPAAIQSATSILSILKITGLVPSLQHAIITLSSLVQPRMIAPP